MRYPVTADSGFEFQVNPISPSPGVVCRFVGEVGAPER